MKSIKSFEGMEVSNLKYFNGGVNTSTGAGEKCNDDGSCSSWTSDQSFTNNGVTSTRYIGEKIVNKPCA